MKTKIEAEHPGFVPRTLSITFESQEEMDALQCLFNYSPTCEFLRNYGIDPFDIHEHLRDQGADEGRLWEEFVHTMNRKKEG